MNDLTIITLFFARCSLSEKLTIGRELQEIAMVKPDISIRVNYGHWPDVMRFEFTPRKSFEFEFIDFMIHRFNDIALEITSFKFDVKTAEEGLTIDYIQKVVCSYFNVPVEMLQSSTHKREIVQARQIAMFFSRSLTKSSLATIGSQIGDKDHATVMHACKTVNNLIETDKHFRLQLNEIEKKIKI